MKRVHTRKAALLRAFIGLALFGASAGALSWTLCAPPIEESGHYPSGLILRDSSGAILRVGLGPGDVDCRPYYKASRDDWIVKAIVAAEDKRFFEHCGMDFAALARAILQNASAMRRVSGASTISSQTTRLIVPHYPRNFRWKYVEMFQSLRMELELTKNEILEQYLNRSPFGSNLIGVESASMGYFGKRASDLSLGEAALLAGMVQAPTRFRPDRHLEQALKRREYVFGKMVALGFATERQCADARRAGLRLQRAPRPFAEPYFCDWAASWIGARSGDFITTLSGDIQEIVKTAVNDAAESDGFEAAAVVMNPATGAVLAMHCSGDYFGAGDGQVNTATSPRHAGSTLKPFLSAIAMDGGLATPSSVLPDVPMHFAGFTPANFSPHFSGLATLSDALLHSLNIPFIDMLRRIGVGRFATTLRSLGFSFMRQPDSSYGLGLATGNAGVTLVELAGAYSCIANGGVLVKPAPLKPDDLHGHPRQRIFSSEACYLLWVMLSAGGREDAATGHGADVRAPRFAWKTGTSAAYRDAWTMAWNPQYVVAVWRGHKTGHFGDDRVVGIRAAAPVAWRIIRALYPDGDSPVYGRPDGIATARLCDASGMVASAICPSSHDGEIIKGVSSLVPCTVHRRDASGAVSEKWPPYVERFIANTASTNASVSIKIVSPVNGAEFRLVPNIPQQGTLVKVSGNASDRKLWWYVNSSPSGETVGNAPKQVSFERTGDIRITCADDFGNSASVNIKVRGMGDDDD